MRWMLVEVALPVPVRTSFTYSVPHKLRGTVVRGARVRVPFRGRKMIGVVLGAAQGPALGAEIKEIDAVLDATPMVLPAVLELAQWIATYYQAPIGEALRMALPPPGPGARRGIGPEASEESKRNGAVRMVRLSPGTDAGALPLDRRASRLRAV